MPPFTVSFPIYAELTAWNTKNVSASPFLLTCDEKHVETLIISLETVKILKTIDLLDAFQLSVYETVDTENGMTEATL